MDIYDIIVDNYNRIFPLDKDRIGFVKSQNLICSECKVHCFNPEMRDKIKQIMRYAGPGMIWKHPFLAIRYLKNKIISNIRKSANK